MGEATGISWCDHTFNAWIGCTKVSPACANCYAERDFDKRLQRVKWGPHGTRSMTSPNTWAQPLRWNKRAEREGIRRRVFCASLADVFEDWNGLILDSKGCALLKPHLERENKPENWIAEPLEIDGTLTTDLQGWRVVTMADVRLQLFDLIDRTPHLDWLLLTKRPENIRRFWPDYPHNACLTGDCPHERADQCSAILERENVWLGTSVENQEYADKRIPELLKCRDLSPVLFLSCEPLLGPLELSRYLSLDATEECPVCNDIGCDHGAIDWVIAGGESGPDARPSHPAWFRSLRDQCSAAGVPFHFKQWGEYGHGCVNLLDNSPCFGSFRSYIDWVNKAPSRIAPGDVCFDERGKVCRIGSDFRNADYPVTIVSRIGTKNSGRLLDGVVHNGFPEGVGDGVGSQSMDV